MDEAMKQWISENLNAGYSAQQLRQALLDSNQDPHLVDEYISFHASSMQIPEKKKPKETSNIFAFVFALASILLLFVAPFLTWFNYGSGSNIESISGISTPFGKALLFVSGSSAILIGAAELLSRKFSIGSIALCMFAIGIIFIAIFTQKTSAGVTTGFNTVANFSVSAAYGIYLALLVGIMSLVGSVLSFLKHEENTRSKMP